MSGPIKKGDLVMVMRPALCGCGIAHRKVGAVFSVVYVTRASWRCFSCGFEYHGTLVATGGRNKRGKRVGYPQLCVKKIDPPSTGEYDGVPVRKQQPRKEPA